MKIRLYIFFILLIIPGKLFSQERYHIEPSRYRNLPFPEFVDAVERTLPVRFFFGDPSLNDLVTGAYNCNTLSCILDSLFKGTPFFYLIEESGNIVVSRDFAIYVPGRTISADSGYMAPGLSPDSDDAGLDLSETSVEIGNPAERSRQGNVALSGYITNTDTKEPVQGVTVFVGELSAGTVSNEFGFYNLPLPRGRHRVQFSFIGMKERSIDLMLYGSGELNIDMKNVLIPLRETVVSAGKNISLRSFETGVEKIDMSAYNLLPAALGESDILKSMLMIPGVLSVGEGSAGFHVRGGSADQNLILLYGAPVYNSSHFFGFFSAVNSDIIKEATLYKGGIPGRYGGRISSVLDITSKSGNRREFAGNAGISPVSAHLSIEGPIVKDTLTYLFTGRSTYSNWIFRVVDNPSLKNSRASFYDLNGKIVYDYNRNNKIDLSLYSSNDDFRFRGDTIYSYRNNIAALTWRHFFNSRFFSSFSLNNSFYKYDISSFSRPDEAFSLAHKINSTGFKADFNRFAGKNEYNFGIDITNYAAFPGTYSPLNDSSLVSEQVIMKERGLETALYFEDRITLSDILSVNLGMRLSGFLAMGPAEVMIYNQGSSRSNSTINDTVNFRPGKIIKKYGGPEIRIAMNFRLDDRNSLKINYNRTRQYLHLLSNTSAISPTDIWKLSGYYVRPQVGDQVSAGYYEIFSSDKVEASVDVFFKSIKNIVDFKGGTSLIMNENIEKDIISMKGRAYGAEFQVKKSEGKLRYNLGYTYSRSFIRSTGVFRDEILNSGEWFPANFDRPHDLMVMFNYIFSRRFSISSDFSWSTGRPVTLPVTAYRMRDDLLLHYSGRNTYRIPDYMRLDFSMRINGNLRSQKLANPYWNFSVYNVMGRKNIYSVFFKNEDGIHTGYSLSVFGTAVPSLSFGFDF